MAVDKSKVMSFGDTVELIKRTHKAAENKGAIKPHFDGGKGRYDNIGDWLDLRKDGLVYGVQIPLYDYSPVTTAIKTGANAGLVLEPSTETQAGRNDYKDKALFECTRCNGGVDADGMPYVTAIEGYDDRFDAKTQNTYIITPVYYRRITTTAQYATFEYTDTPRDGFTACFGANTADGKPRPFILRACYTDSDGKCSSKSGTLPATLAIGKINHCLTYDLTNSKNREDGLTFLTYGDICYQQDFMELMLGVKAPRSQVVGCASYNFQYNLAQAEESVKRVVLTNAQAANIEVGSYMSVSNETPGDKNRNNNNMHATASSVRVLSKESLGDGKTAINLDLTAPITTKTEYVASTMPWANGTCDKVLGTYGTRTAAARTNGHEPFRFQNCEWNLGMWTVICDYMSVATVEETISHQKFYLASDVTKCTAADAGTGWTQMTATMNENKAVKYIKDYTVEKGARIPSSLGGSTSTGYMVGCWPYGAQGNHEILVGGDLNVGAAAGVGAFAADSVVSNAYWNIGGRSSTIGHSAPAE